MTALTQDKKTQWREGMELAVPVAESQTIYAGALVMINAAGYLLPGADTASMLFAGVARQYVDNSSGSNGDASCLIQRSGLFRMKFGTAISQANLGDKVYLDDDQTVDVAGNCANDVFVGVIAEVIDTDEAWVDITPATSQTDVAAHLSDATAAHAASAIAVADDGEFTDLTNVETVLQALLQDALSAAHVIPVPLSSVTQEDGTALTKFTPGTAPGFQQLADKEVVLTWDGNATPDAAAVVIPLVDPAIDDSADISVHVLAKMAGTTDTPVLAMEAYFGAGDTDCAGTDPEITGGVTLTEYTMTIAAADVPAAPSSLTLVLTPTSGEMNTDELHVYGIWLETKRKLRAA